MKKPSIDNVNDRIRFVILKYKEKKTLIDKLHLKLLNRYYPNNENYEREIWWSSRIRRINWRNS